jgi:hypothetical protein
LKCQTIDDSMKWRIRVRRELLPWLHLEDGARCNDPRDETIQMIELFDIVIFNEFSPLSIESYLNRTNWESVKFRGSIETRCEMILKVNLRSPLSVIDWWRFIEIPTCWELISPCWNLGESCRDER